MKNRKKEKAEIDDIKFNMVPLTVLMLEMKTTVLPKKIPYGYVLVSYSGIPYMVPSGVYNKYKNKLSLM